MACPAAWMPALPEPPTPHPAQPRHPGPLRAAPIYAVGQPWASTPPVGGVRPGASSVTDADVAHSTQAPLRARTGQDGRGRACRARKKTSARASSWSHVPREGRAASQVRWEGRGADRGRSAADRGRASATRPGTPREEKAGEAGVRQAERRRRAGGQRAESRRGVGGKRRHAAMASRGRNASGQGGWPGGGGSDGGSGADQGASRKKLAGIYAYRGQRSVVRVRRAPVSSLRAGDLYDAKRIRADVAAAGPTHAPMRPMERATQPTRVSRAQAAEASVAGSVGRDAVAGQLRGGWAAGARPRDAGARLPSGQRRDARAVRPADA